jgi:RsiW-degrading membrane proteinase PrsW (M82 family)
MMLLLEIGTAIPAMNCIAVDVIRFKVIPLQMIIVCLLLCHFTLHAIKNIVVILGRYNTVLIVKRIASLLWFYIILAAPGKKDDHYKKPFHSTKVTNKYP